MWANDKRHLDVARLLLDEGADLNIQDHDGFTALIVASSQGHLEIARLLLDRGATTDIQDNNGRTALVRATGKGQIELERLLIKRGADDVNVKEKDGWAALISPNEEHHADIARLFLDRAKSL